MASKNRIIISCRMAFLNCWKPSSLYGGQKYSMVALIPKEDVETVNKIHNIIEYVKGKYVDKWGGSVPENLRIPLHDGDIEKSGNITFKNCYYLNAKSKDAPQIVDQNVKPIVNHGELYSGCYGNVSMIFYAYNHCGNKGIGVWLGNIQKVRDGAPLCGRIHASSEFKPVQPDDYLQ